jgi:hypothetical protein
MNVTNLKLDLIFTYKQLIQKKNIVVADKKEGFMDKFMGEKSIKREKLGDKTKQL